MANGDEELIDSQFILENVEFLDCSNNFDVTTDCKALKRVTELYVEEEKQKHPNSGSKKLKRRKHPSQNKTLALEASLNYSSQVDLAALNDERNKKLCAWGLPDAILQKYESRGIKEMFEWQVSCLANSKVLLDCCNLVYSAPTSAGKTLVAEILTIKTLLERQKKVIIILPFVSIVREKTFYLQDILSSSGIRVEGFMGSQTPPGGLQSVHVAICTIEKANSLINKLLDEGSISELGAVIVDEMHLLGDPHRGYILELLLTKIMFVSSKCGDVQIQIVGMSATLPNLEVLARWLKAELFVTNFRPIPLDEYCLVGKQYYTREGTECVQKEVLDSDMFGNDIVLKICFDTIKEGCSILIFCMTKNRCESLAQKIALSFYKLGCSGNELGSVLRKQLKTDAILEVLEQLKSCSVGLDNVLKNSISFGVAYHHAGLTFDERDIIEGSFKSGAIRVLVATSTLSSGVNLPARKVIIRTPVFLKQPINILTYKQMIGRAGRMGKDTKGESILICTEAEKKVGMNLMMGALEPVSSCIEDDDKFMRTILEIIASEVACTNEELELYVQCTLLFKQKEVGGTLLKTTLQKLKQFELIRLQDADDSQRFVATSLGKACLSSSMAPNDGLSLFFELQKVRECCVLENDLHLIYLVTPYSVSSQWADLDWLHLLTMYQNMSRTLKRVCSLVGVEESFITRRVNDNQRHYSDAWRHKVGIHSRFYTALALHDLVNEVPLTEVATKFHCARGFLQSLQQASATFAGMVTVFCRQLGWKNMEMLVAQFQDRLHFGIHSELIELMKLPSLNGIRSRALFSAGLETIANVAAADRNIVENALLKAIPFQSEKQRDNDDEVEVRKRNKMKNVWITGHCGMTTRDAAENLIIEARRHLQLELGVTDIKWDKTDDVKDNQAVTEAIIRDEIIEPADNTICVSNTMCIKLDKTDDIKDNQAFSEAIIKYEAIEPTDNTKCVSNTMNEIEENNQIKHNSEAKAPKTSIRKACVKIPMKYLSKTMEEKEKNVNILNENVETDKGQPENEIQWESLNFTDVALSNVTKKRVSDNIFSPQICFNESDVMFENNDKSTPKSKEISSMEVSKDVSLFSADGTDNSLFEDSLPIDQIPSRLLEDGNEKPEACGTDNVDNFLTLNTVSIANAFNSEIILDDEEDIQLVYDDDDDKVNDIAESNNASKAQGNLKDLKEIVDDTLAFLSPHKHKTNVEGTIEPLLKKRKVKNYNHDILPPTSCKIITPNEVSMSSNIMTLDEVPSTGSFILDKRKVSYYVINENDDIILADNIKTAAISFGNSNKTYNKKVTDSVIGSKMCSSRPQSSNQLDAINSMAINIYCGFGSVLVLNTTWKRLNNFRFHSTLLKWLPKIIVRVASLKDAYAALKKQYEVDVTSFFDILLAQWFINTDEKEPTLDELLRTYSIAKDNRNISTIAKCVAVWEIAEKQQSFLPTKPYSQIPHDMEHQVAIILLQCEYTGITVDKSLVQTMLRDLKNYRDTIEAKLFETCGHRFNIRSPQEVAKLLGIDKPRRVSTKKSILMGLGPVAHMVMLWRKLEAILTKTLYPLTEQAVIYSKDNKIKPSYTMFTSTGRMSMHEPNLQSVPRNFSIPVEFISKDRASKAGVVECNCRDVFQASPGYELVSADYCQLEMRVLTHFCKDQVLTGIMRSPGADVFKSIAASWCDIPEKDVDDELRQKTKQLCYGIIYGMGVKSLSVSLGITAAEASVLMHSFDISYPAISRFKSGVIAKCSANGYVETLMKRRRCLPGIRLNPKDSRKAQAERQAVNTTIQGSAADVAKAAMCAIDNHTRRQPECRRARLLLQMHDELIYEVPTDATDGFVVLLKHAMENSVQLNVPLPVKVKMGAAWGSLKEITITSAIIHTDKI